MDTLSTVLIAGAKIIGAWLLISIVASLLIGRVLRKAARR